jgi:hypothetical protein
VDTSAQSPGFFSLTSEEGIMSFYTIATLRTSNGPLDEVCGAEQKGLLHSTGTCCRQDAVTSTRKC